MQYDRIHNFTYFEKEEDMHLLPKIGDKRLKGVLKALIFFFLHIAYLYSFCDLLMWIVRSYK